MKKHVITYEERRNEMAKMNFVAMIKDTGEIVAVTQRKKNKNTFEENFFMTECSSAEVISADKDLNGTDFRVLWFLLSRINYNNVAILPQVCISEKVNTQHSMVSASIKKLCEKGYIEKVSVDKANGYLVNKDFAIKGKRGQKRSEL